MRILVLLTLASLIFFSASSPSGTENILMWDESALLTWQDFLGKPDPMAKGDAASKVSIRATPFKRGKQLYYDVNTVFHRSESWCKVPSAELLEHEQIHFDIAELYARKARKKISSLKRQGIRDVNVYNAAISRIFDESNLTDAKYDRETVHGVARKKQTEWEYSIRIELMLHNRFSKNNWKH